MRFSEIKQNLRTALLIARLLWAWFKIAFQAPEDKIQLVKSLALFTDESPSTHFTTAVMIRTRGLVGKMTGRAGSDPQACRRLTTVLKGMGKTEHQF